MPCGRSADGSWSDALGLPSAIERVLSEESYKQNALRLQEAIGRSGGARRAADIIEQVASTGKPVLVKAK